MTSELESSCSFPIIDLRALHTEETPPDAIRKLTDDLSHAFSTSGFAYLINCPISFTDVQIFSLAQTFFALPWACKNSIAKKSFNPLNGNTYHGYFPIQPDSASDNLKEGLEIGPPDPVPNRHDFRAKVNLAEANVWPAAFTRRQEAEQLYCELQSLSQRLLSLLALGLGKTADLFDYMHENSISTLRFLHYPSASQSGSCDGETFTRQQEFCCTPHTDSGILTLLHQDSTGGLEVLTNPTGHAKDAADNNSAFWTPVPYIPNSIVINIGDLMSRLSGGRYIATQHRVRASGQDRYSVPFFFEPGIECRIKSIMDESDPGVIYGEHVLEKMKGWAEFKENFIPNEGRAASESQDLKAGREIMVTAA